MLEVEVGCNPISLLGISYNWVNIRLNNKIQLYKLPGSAFKVCVLGGWSVVLKVNVVNNFC